MKRLIIAGIAAAGLMLSAGAHAQNWSGPEAGVQGGFGWGSSKGNVNGVAPYNFSPDGGLGGFHAGFNWQFNNFVLGIEGDAEGGGLSKNAGVAPGFSVDSNLDFDASVRGKLGVAFNRFLVYGTGGVEFGHVKTSYIAPLGTAEFSGNRTGWTAGAGIDYAFTRNWEGNVEYRYADLGSAGITTPPVVDRNSFDYNMIRVGLTYRFAPPPPPPPPMAQPMPAAAPAPPPPPPPRTFLVFFNFDRYNLTPEARRVVRSAAETYKETGIARIKVSGYTDLAGTQAYNLRLSERRADAVAAYLHELGVPRHVMDVRWFGKEHPRVPTPNGVREPQNRRVEIVMP